MEEAIFLTKFADKVTIVHRRDEFRASSIMLDRARANEKIEWVTNAVVEEVLGDDEDDRRPAARHADRRDVGAAGGRPLRRDRPRPEHEALPRLARPRRRAATSITKPGSTETNIPGVFAVGDVQDHVYRQAVTAAGSGCMGALDAERFLAAREGHLMAAESAPRS